MKRNDVEIQANGADIIITIEGNSCWLSQALKRELEFYETVMCEANAVEAKRIAEAFHSLAEDTWRWYVKWEEKGFERDKSNV